MTLRTRLARLEGSLASGSEITLEMLIAFANGAAIPTDAEFAAAAARSWLVLALAAYATNGTTSH
jgi:hypothetical protein